MQYMNDGSTVLDHNALIGRKVLGAPSKDEILAMNKNYTQFRFPTVCSSCFF